MKRWILHWSVQDLASIPPWPVCAGHRETVRGPLVAARKHWEDQHNLVVTEVTDGKCALGAFGNCCDDPVTVTPRLDVQLLENQ